MKRNNILIFVSIILFTGCLSDDTPPQLTSDQKRYVDSVFNSNVRLFRKQSDLACDSLREKLYPQYVDSIMELRLIEVDQIINDR
jgi:hypothetical protein